MANEFVESWLNPLDSKPPYPTLSTRGWVRSAAEKVDRIFAHYCINQHSQTNTFRGNVRSLPYTVKTFFSQPPALADAIQTELETLLKPFFDHVVVTVTFEQREDEFGNFKPEYDYTIMLDIIHAGYKWRQFKEAWMKDSKFEIVTNINNEGKISLV